MKKYLTLILIILSTVAYSQTHSIGLKSGATFSKISNVPFAGEANFRIAFTGGLTYDYIIENNIIFGAELLYMQKGYNFDISFTNDEGIVLGQGISHAKYNYLSLPLKAGYSIGNQFSGFMNIGIVPALLTNAYYKASDPNNLFPEREDFEKVDLMKNSSNFEFSGLLEIGVGLQVSNKISLNTTISGQYGFTPITNFENQENEMKNYSLYWTFGLKYAISKE